MDQEDTTLPNSAYVSTSGADDKSKDEFGSRQLIELIVDVIKS